MPISVISVYQHNRTRNSQSLAFCYLICGKKNESKTITLQQPLSCSIMMTSLKENQSKLSISKLFSIMTTYSIFHFLPSKPGITKRPVKMNKETRLTPFRYVRVLYSKGCTYISKTYERHIVSFGDFDFRIKQKTLSHTHRPFLRPMLCKATFFTT